MWEILFETAQSVTWLRPQFFSCMHSTRWSVDNAVVSLLAIHLPLRRRGRKEMCHKINVQLLQQ